MFSPSGVNISDRALSASVQTGYQALPENSSLGKHGGGMEMTCRVASPLVR